MTTYAESKKARFDYVVLETFEAGIELMGIEVKSVKSGRANLAGSYAVIRGGEIFLLNADIPPYQQNNTPEGYDATRTRKLLLKKEEIRDIIRKMQSERLTLVPLTLYSKRGLVKVALGLCKGKKKADKRETIRRREADREIARTLKT